MPLTEIAYAKRSSTLSGIVGNALAVIPIAFDTGEEFIVPRQNRPCYLVGSAILVADTPSSSESVELAIIRATNDPTVPLNLVMSSSHGVALVNGQRQWCFARLDPGTPGARYQLAGTVTSGNFTVLSPSHSHAFLWAFI